MRTTFIATLCGAALFAGTAPRAHAQSGLTTLWSFTGGVDGSSPAGGLVTNGSGQLFGDTDSGADGYGTVYDFDISGNSLNTVYTFTGRKDGGQPQPKLTLGSNGTIYGATRYGGTANSGVVFAVDPSTETSTTLYSFQNLTDGGDPIGGLLLTTGGNLIGVAASGGQRNFGDVFEVNPSALTETVLYSFDGGGDGKDPNILSAYKKGVYGTNSEGGGANDAGTIYYLVPNTGRERTVYRFTGGNDGSLPNGSLLLDPSGVFYGTTLRGGAGDAGTIFKFDPKTSQLTTVYAFTGGADGSHPLGGLAEDAAGNLYGTTKNGQGQTNTGSLFSFNVSSGTFTTLVNFTGQPNGNLLLTNNTIYGTTLSGGQYGFGTVYSYTP
jgi:uncharacterized repeat protein (TIGR03803 family)